MSKRDWKPGDVAVVEGSVMLRTGRGWLFAALNGGSWSHAEGASADRVTSLARPLVVIDPEDSEQVVLLMNTFWDQGDRNKPDGDYGAREMQAALREFATPTPPRPEEPQGLGAVVEDAEGDRWVLYTNPRNDAPWCNGCASVDYADIAAVRVLSDGVTP